MQFLMGFFMATLIATSFGGGFRLGWLVRRQRERDRAACVRRGLHLADERKGAA